MKKLLLLLLLIPVQLYAQLSMDLFSTGNQVLIENSIQNCFFVAKQSYQIQDIKTKEIFGLGGKETFGVSYTIGIKIIDGCVISDETLNPWNYDEKFLKYKNDYSPILCKSEFSEMAQDAQYKPFDIDSSKASVIGDSLYYMMKTHSFNSKGLEVDETYGEKVGWLVWISLKDDQNIEESAELNYIISRHKVQIDKEAKEAQGEIVVPMSNNKILCGIFIVPYYSYGNITFKLSGILAERNNEWKLLSPLEIWENQHIGKVKDSRSNRNNTIAEEDETLTPISKKKTKSKKR